MRDGAQEMEYEMKSQRWDEETSVRNVLLGEAKGREPGQSWRAVRHTQEVNVAAPHIKGQRQRQRSFLAKLPKSKTFSFKWHGWIVKVLC